ncbi:hypothetical protein B4907_22250 [Yersinia kristensenii]|nr:hypothetical protein B4907_22250 [Yersinia kristensenii]
MILWNFVHHLKLSEIDHAKIVIACVGMLEMVESCPHWRPKAMDFWQLSDERRFADSPIAIARNPQQGFSTW